MFARVTTVQGSPSRAEEGTRALREQVLPAVRQISGFRGALSLLDRETGKALSVTLWESEEAMRESEETANRLRGDAVQAMGGGAPTVERYEVVLDERS